MSKFVDLGEKKEGMKGQEMYVVMHQHKDGTVDSVMMVPDLFDGYTSAMFHSDVDDKKKQLKEDKDPKE